jgi:DNA repair exonuclease SbcCD ATPase subunit
MEKEIHTGADWQTEKDRLNGDIRRLEAALIEAKEVTRVNLTEEISDEFTIKVREAKRDRARIEEEFEDATTQWRTERRRLNAEIDGLEESVQKLRTDARRVRPSDGSGSPGMQAELEEATRLQKEAEDSREDVKK